MPTKLWKNDFFKTKEQFFNFREIGQPILKQLNYTAIIMSGLKLISVVVTGHVPLTLSLPILTYALPFILCVAVHFAILKRSFDISFFLAFYCVPVSIILLGFYEQMTLLSIYLVAYGVIAFFTMHRSGKIISSYIFSTLAILALGLNEIISTGYLYSYRTLFLLFNFFTFFIPFYFILGYLRRIIEYNQKSIKNKKNQLAIQKELLETQNEQLIEQEHLLEIKHQSLVESTVFQNKIIAVLSHDIRVPLLSIRNLFNSISKNNLPKEKIIEYLPDIEENINYLYGMFEDMLSWSKEQKEQHDNKKTYLSLKEISEEICHSYSGAATGKSIRIINTISQTKIVFANERYIKVILRNLLSNAIKFTNLGGIITITADKQGNFDVVSVKDTGKGISKENLYKIRNGLEVNYKGTLNESGTGIGLYFCKEFAHKSGGSLSVESEIGKGSIFSFMLPEN